MPGLAEAVAGAVGQPATVRIGTVDSLGPTVITAQGVPFDDVGFLGSYAPVEGDTVVLLGQSSEAGSDPASWLALGSVNSGPRMPLLQAGETLFTFVAVASAFVDITFNTEFSSNPSVTGNIAASSGVANLWFVRCVNVTTTGFRLLVSAAAAASWTNIPVQWMAMEQTQ